MDWYAWLCRAGLHPDVAFEYALLFARNELGAADVRHLDHEFLLSMGVAVAKHRLEILKLARKDSSSSNGGRAAVVAAAAVTALPWRATRLLAAAVHRSARSALARLRASVSSSSRARRDGGHRDRRAAAVVPFATPRLPLLAVRHYRGGAGRVAHSSWTKIAASSSPVGVRGGGKPPLPALPMLTNGVSKPVLLTNSRADKWRGKSNGAGAAVRALPAPPGSIAAACLVSTDDQDDVFSFDEDEEGDGSGSDVEVVVVVDVGGEGEMRWESMFQDLKPT